MIWSPDGQFFITRAEKPLLFTAAGELLYELDIPGGSITSWVIPPSAQPGKCGVSGREKGVDFVEVW